MIGVGVLSNQPIQKKEEMWPIKYVNEPLFKVLNKHNKIIGMILLQEQALLRSLLNECRWGKTKFGDIGFQVRDFHSN